MTHHTDAERAEFEAVASDNGKWPKAIERDANGNYLLMQTASGWAWWQVAWQAARRDPAAPVPQGWQIVPVEPTDAMLAATSWPGCAKVDYAHMLAAAPQPPEAAPVELPEPAGVVHSRLGDLAGFKALPFVRKGEKLYTEQQVRELLAANGIGGAA